MHRYALIFASDAFLPEYPSISLHVNMLSKYLCGNMCAVDENSYSSYHGDNMLILVDQPIVVSNIVE